VNQGTKSGVWKNSHHLSRLHNDVDLLYRAKGREQLPQCALGCVVADVVGKDHIASLKTTNKNFRNNACNNANHFLERWNTAQTEH
jgi:hypothetical protein